MITCLVSMALTSLLFIVTIMKIGLKNLDCQGRIFVASIYLMFMSAMISHMLGGNL